MIIVRNFLVFFILIISFVSSHATDMSLMSDRRIRTYLYNPNDVYLLSLNHRYQTIIEFDMHEDISTISMGDVYSLKLTPMGNKVFIRPLEDNIRTNMAIITNKRVYYFDVVSSGEKSLENDTEVMYVVRFYYSKDTQRERK